MSLDTISGPWTGGEWERKGKLAASVDITQGSNIYIERGVVKGKPVLPAL